MTGYERINRDDAYFYEDSQCCMNIDYENNTSIDDEKYANANYYSNETVAENNARADKLMRQLRRFAVEHNDCELDWDNDEQNKCDIFYNYKCECLNIGYHYYTKNFGQIYFSSDEIAEQAIEEFKDELIWYFTKYQDHFVDDGKMVKEKCGCELCRNDNLSNIGIHDNQIGIWLGGNKPSDEQRLKYCPKCGRELED